MELYNKVSFDVSRVLTEQYSTSFSSSAKLFPSNIRQHIYAIYGLVRIADEVVDMYRGQDVAALLDDLEREVYAAIKRGYSTNPIVQSFAVTAREFSIDQSLIRPFFKSMKMDLSPTLYSLSLYKEYIHGSAEVVGLMCLKVFCEKDDALYSKLEKGAIALGAAYQKVNFLRDVAADHDQLGRLYFPNVTYETFDDRAKAAIVKDIEKDFARAAKALPKLPENSRKAVTLSYTYYNELLRKLKRTPAAVLKKRRVRVATVRKALLRFGVIRYAG